MPSYDLFLIALGPIVLGLLWLLFQRTRWGVLVRAATQDRDMVAALGVNQKWLFTGVFALGVFLGGARRGAGDCRATPSITRWTLRIIVDVFVVVVIGGLGQHRRRLRRGRAGLRIECLRHPDLSEDIASSWCSW